MPKLLLETKNLSVGYASKLGAVCVANAMNLQFKAGELVCLIGPNGAGKSTILKTLAGLLEPLSGEVLVQNEKLSSMPLRTRAKQLAMVLTHFPKVHGMTGRQNVALGRSPHTGWLDRLSAQDLLQIENALIATDCMGLADRFVDAMSDGERQRLAIARALAQEASILLLDEPTAFLDLPHRVSLFVFLRKLAREQGHGVLLSTHDLELALRFADRIIVVHQGQVEWDIPEVLVLNHVMENVFSKEDVRFDIKSGSFQVSGGSNRTICCIGNDLTALWTGRALERLGWTLVPEGYPKVEVIEESGHKKWIVRDSEYLQRETHSLETLVQWFM